MIRTLKRGIVAQLILLGGMVRNEVRSRYLSSYLGVVWLFLNPIATTAILWVVLQYGFKSPPRSDVPYFAWLICGLIPWFFIAEALSLSTTAIRDNSFLVKKIVFNVTYLPLVRLLTALLVHLVFLVLLLIVLLSNGVELSISSLTVFYYTAAGFMLLFFTALILSSLAVFIPDVVQFVGMAVQMGFWITPIFWDINAVGGRLSAFASFNPFSYIVNGYRAALLHGAPPQMSDTLYFWGLVAFLCFFSIWFFKRTKGHFADVL